MIIGVYVYLIFGISLALLMSMSILTNKKKGKKNVERSILDAEMALCDYFTRHGNPDGSCD